MKKIILIPIILLLLITIAIAITSSISNDDVMFIIETRYNGTVTFSCNKEIITFVIDEPNTEVDDDISDSIRYLCPSGKVSNVVWDNEEYEDRKPFYKKATNSPGLK